MSKRYFKERTRPRVRDAASRRITRQIERSERAACIFKERRFSIADPTKPDRRSAFFHATAAIATLLLTLPTTQALTPTEAATQATANNPELRAARHLLAEAEGRARTTGRLANPELQIELGAGPEAQARGEIALTQRFPLTARLALERRRSAIQIEMARLEIADRTRLIAGRAQAATIELAATRKAIALATAQIKTLETFAKSLTTQSAEGLTSTLEASQTDLAAATLAAEATTLAVTEITATAELATLLGQPLTAELPVTLPPLPASPPAHRTPTTRSDLRLAELAVESGDTSVSIARASRWDDIGVGVFYEGERLAADEGGFENEAIAGVRVSIPLPLWQKGTGAIAEQTAIRDRRQSELVALRLTIRNEADAAHRLLVAAYQTARTYDSKLLPAARRQIEATEAAYQQGEVDYPTLFAARTRLAEAETDALTARKAYHLAHARWLTTTEP